LVLDNAIPLWTIGHCVLMMHTLSHTVLREFLGGELASTISAERPQLQVGLAFYPCLDLLDSSCCTIFAGDCSYLQVPAEIIHEQPNILVTPQCCRCDWITQVTVY
jgi:hypothetical protein